MDLKFSDEELSFQQEVKDWVDAGTANGVIEALITDK